MRVILNDYVDNLGERGDTVDVAPGYARNYLIPKRLAYPDTAGNRKLFAQEQKRWENMDLTRRSAAEKVAAGLEGIELIFERRAGEKDVLFGSVSLLDISRELAERGIDIDKRKIALDEPIKELGSYEVELRIHREIAVTVPIHVVRPGEEPQPEGAVEEPPAEPESAADAVVQAALAEMEVAPAETEPEDVDAV
jgi:large subunit ribosomal protein L9